MIFSVTIRNEPATGEEGPLYTGSCDCGWSCAYRQRPARSYATETHLFDHDLIARLAPWSPTNP